MFENAIREIIEKAIKEEGANLVDDMVKAYADKLRANSAHLISGIALNVMEQVSMHRAGRELVITVRLPKES
jgi:hypothetical protein